MAGKLYGAGVRNMKAGVAVKIEAVLMIQRAAMPWQGNLVIACVHLRA
jgi:acetylornithine deacetylase/succinyl-diaminopimelate desuccinylase-like protein